MISTDLRLAVLIDADNISYKNIKEILEEITTLGVPTIKRIYADWTKPTTNGWKEVLLENAIQPIQQYSYTVGKNSTDSALIIDGMDILYSGKVDGFCILSSDSDFTRLATRLREAGKRVYGFGEKKTPSPFIASCDKFTYIEIFNRATNQFTNSHSGNNKSNKAGQNTPRHPKVERDTIELIHDTIEILADDFGWAFLGDVGNLLTKKKPDFDPRNYGYQKLTPMMKNLNQFFEIDERETNNPGIKHNYIRNTKKAF